MKKVILLATIALVLSLPNKAHAIFIVDTGTPDETAAWSLFNSSNGYQWLAGQFTTTQSWIIDSVEGYMDGTVLGVPGFSISLAIYGDNSDNVDTSNELARKNFTPGFVPGSDPDPDWHGASLFSLNLPAGTYWAAFEVLNEGDYSGVMYGDATSPLSNYAAVNHTTTNYIEADFINIGIRIDASEVQLGDPVVPEPATMALFGSGLLGAFVRRRKLSK